MIDWNDNAKAAVREFADYIGQSDKCERYMEAFATKKTVADAVEALKDRNPCINYDYVAVCKIAHSDWLELEVGDFEFVGEGYYKEIFDIVCTREQFEAYVKEQEGEKWTHVVETTGKKCQLLTKEPDSDGYYAVILSSGNYDIEHSDFIKPIKPTMSESEAWRKMNEKAKYNKNYNLAIQQIKEQYDII